MKAIWYISTWLAIVMAAASLCPVLPSFISLVTLMATGHSITPQVVFTAILLMATVEITFADYCYRGIYCASKFAATMERLQQFLYHDNERQPASANSKARQTHSKWSFAGPHPHVSLSKVTSTIGQRGTVLLDNVSVTFQGSESIGVVGSIGSGKSSLLRAIIGEQDCLCSANSMALFRNNKRKHCFRRDLRPRKIFYDC